MATIPRWVLPLCLWGEEKTEYKRTIEAISFNVIAFNPLHTYVAHRTLGKDKLGGLTQNELPLNLHFNPHAAFPATVQVRFENRIPR